MVYIFILIRYESVIVAREEGRMLQEQLLKKQKKVIYDIIQLRDLLLFITNIQLLTYWLNILLILFVLISFIEN